MTTWRLNAHNADTRGNEVLRAVRLWSGQDRGANSNNHYTVRVGVGAEGKVDWLGEWDGARDALIASQSRDLLGRTRPHVRLAAGAPILIEVERVGSPNITTSGLTVELHLDRVAGNSETERPLFHAGGFITDARTREAISVLERQLNSSGVASRTISVPLSDPAGEGELSRGFDDLNQARLRTNSLTEISLVQFRGNYVAVNGALVDISSNPTCTTSDQTITATGANSGSTPSSSTLYYVYLGGPDATNASGKIRLSTTVPTFISNGRGFYLGASGNARNYRHMGWLYSNSSTQFVDSVTSRHLVNRDNKLLQHLILTPGYNNNNAETTYTTTSTSFTPANGGTGATGSYVANGEDAVFMHLYAQMSATAGSGAFAGIGDNSTTAAVASCTVSSTVPFSASCGYSSVPNAGYRTVSLLVRTTGGTSTYRADNARGGSAADPYATALVVGVMV